MTITSVGFLLFCTVLLLIYYVVPGRFQWVVLLCGSYLFYASQPQGNLAYILFTTLTTYGTSLYLDHLRGRFDKKTARQRGKPWLLLCLTANFGLLFGCKVNLLRGGLLPLGISFYLFQSVGYLVDVYRGTVPPERHPGKLALFISYLPQLIQGPISRSGALLPQLTAPHGYDGKQVSFGLQRMLWGFFKKLVIAERAAPAVTALRGTETSLLPLSLLYAIQIYGDFTGGIDIVLGLSQALDICLSENFCRPFFSKNTAEFWRRWHITLGAWMKEYIFYPVSISAPLRRFSKFARKRLGPLGKRLPVYVASLATWFVTGIWHGLTPNFILWGMLNCGVIIISEELSPLYARFHARFSLKERRWYGAFEILRTFLLMNLIRTVDLFPNLGDYFRRMARPFSLPSMDALGLTRLDQGILLAGIVLMLTVSLVQEKHGSIRELLWQQSLLVRYGLTFALFLVVLLMGCYGIGYESGNFIYGGF